MQLVVIAKAPVPGQVKTRLCPPFSPVDAARIAEASLADTLDAVAATPATRRVVSLAGDPGPWLPEGFEVIGQRGAGLAERLANTFADCFAAAPHDPVVIIGMDTPQVRSRHLIGAGRALDVGAADGPAGRSAVLGPAADGGYWLIGLDAPHPDAIRGVPMSTTSTFRWQRDRLRACGYDVRGVESLRDVDEARHAFSVARSIPASRFARAVATAAARSSSPAVVR